MTDEDEVLARWIREGCRSLIELASQMEEGRVHGKEANEWAGADVERLLSYVNEHGESIDWDAEG